MSQRKVPPEYTKTSQDFCSNYDHDVNHEVIEQLKTQDVYADYPAWDWFGKVWFDKSPTEQQFYCQVMRYGSHIYTANNPDPLKLKEFLCKTYGQD